MILVLTNDEDIKDHNIQDIKILTKYPQIDIVTENNCLVSISGRPFRTRQEYEKVNKARTIFEKDHILQTVSDYEYFEQLIDDLSDTDIEYE